MIINISLIIIFCCLSAIVLSSRIEMKWFAKLVMCIMMISIIGVGASLNTNFNKFYGLWLNIFFSCLAFIACFVTYWTNKRGSYK